MRHETSDLARILLEHGADPNSKSQKGETPLHMLFRNRERTFSYLFPRRRLHAYIPFQDFAQLLLNHGADVNSQDKAHVTPLHWAMRHTTSDVARILLEHGADPNSKSQDGETPLHILLGSRDWRDYAAVDHAVLQLLLNHDADVNAQCKRLRTPLHLASHLGRSAIAQVLLDHGAKPNVEDDHGKTPLHLVSQGRGYSNEQSARDAQLLIARGADVNARDMVRRTPLHYASHNGIHAIIQVLLEHGGNPNVGDKNDQTPLHLAVQLNDTFNAYFSPSVGIARLLLKHGADVDAQDDDHVSPLELSTRCERKDPEIIKLLREHSANVFCICNMWMLTRYCRETKEKVT